MQQFSARDSRRFFKTDVPLWFTKQGLYSVTPRVCSEQIESLIPYTEIVDACCGIGGDLCTFAEKHRAIGYELNPETAEVARRNVKALGLDAPVVQANFLDVVAEMKTDCVYLDLPWGGVDYRSDKMQLGLSLTGEEGSKMVHLHEIIGQNSERAELFIAKVPTNYDANQLRDLSGRDRLFSNVEIVPVRRQIREGKTVVAYNIVVLSNEKRQTKLRPVQWRGYKDLLRVFS